MKRWLGAIALLGVGAAIGIGASFGYGLGDDGHDCPVKRSAADRVVPGLTSTPAPPDDAGAPTPKVRLARIASGLDKPTSVGTAPDGELLWVTEKSGRIIAVDPQDEDEVQGTALDLRGRVGASDLEQGLMSFAVVRRDQVAVFFTDRSDDVRIQLLTIDGELIRSTRELVRVHKPRTTHNGGTVTVGPDGLLYAGFGDGGGRDDPDDNAQDCSNLLGKIISIDPHVARSARAPGDRGIRIRAWGVRNPFRLSFDDTGDGFYVGDVGQRRFEEVDAIPARELHGVNFGWDVFEGDARFERSALALGALVSPIVTMGHPAACAVTGGVVYRGRAIPELEGMYLYADLCQQRLRGFRLRDGAVAQELDAPGASQVVGFGHGPDGEVYAVGHDGNVYAVRRSGGA